MNDESFLKMLFLTSPAGKDFLASLQEQCEGWTPSLQTKFDEMLKQKCAILKEKYALLQKLNDEILTELGYKTEK